MVRQVAAFAFILLLGTGCATTPQVLIEQESLQREWTTALPFERGVAVREDDVWRVFLRFHTDGSPIVSDDEITYSFLLTVPINGKATDADLCYAFFVRRLHGPPFEGYADVTSASVKNDDGKTLTVTCTLTSTLVHSPTPDARLKASFSNVRVPVSETYTGSELESVQPHGFGQFFRERFAKGWEGIMTPPPAMVDTSKSE